MPFLALRRPLRKAPLIAAATIFALIPPAPHALVTRAEAAALWYVATTGSDANDCLSPATACASLGGALAKSVPGDTVNVAAGTYSTDVTITAAVTIVGAGAGATILDGGRRTPVVTIDDAGPVSLSGLTVQNGWGNAQGGGIINDGVMALSNSTIQGNYADGVGGGMENWGDLTMTGVTVTGNSSRYSGSGISNDGVLTMTASQIITNLSYTFGGGIANTYLLTATDSLISGNTVQSGNAGGIYNETSGSVLVLDHSTLSGQVALGIENEGTLTVTASTLSGNASAALSNFFGPAAVVNSTLSNNAVGVANTGGNVSLTNDTIGGNSNPYASGTVAGIGNSGTLTVANTIVAGNTTLSGPGDCAGAFISGGHNLIGVGDGCTGITNGVNGDQVGTTAHPVLANLGPLQDNGGPTATMAELSGSPAIDGVPAGACVLGTDQRDQPRPDETADGGACDIGAYEALAPTTLVATPILVTPLQSVVLTGTDFLAGEPINVYWDSATGTPLVTTTSSLSGTATVTLSAPQAVSGTHTLIAVGQTDGVSATATIQVRPVLLVTPSSGRVGQRVSVTGVGFGPAEHITLYWDKPQTALGTTSSNGVGSFSGATAVLFTVPSKVAPGMHVVYAASQGRRLASARFTVP